MLTREEIEKVLAEMNEAFNAHDLDAVTRWRLDWPST